MAKDPDELPPFTPDGLPAGSDEVAESAATRSAEPVMPASDAAADTGPGSGPPADTTGTLASEPVSTTSNPDVQPSSPRLTDTPAAAAPDVRPPPPAEPDLSATPTDAHPPATDAHTPTTTGPEGGLPAPAPDVQRHPPTEPDGERPTTAPDVQPPTAIEPVGESAAPDAATSPSAEVEVAGTSLAPDGELGAEHDAAVAKREDDGDSVDDDAGGIDEADDTGRHGSKVGGLLTKQVQVEAKHILIVAAILAATVGAYLLGHRQGKQLEGATAPRTTSSTAFKVPKDFETIGDDATGVKLSLPKDWVRYSTQGLDPAIRIAVGVPNTSDTVVVRVNAYSREVTKDNVEDQKNVFDQLLAGEKIKLLVNQPVTVRGLPALFYVYSFTDQQSGKTGIHAHYFVFQGRKMVSMIFQALPPERPEDRYKELAPVYDTIMRSLEVAPGPPPAFLEQLGSTSTTAAGAPTPSTAPPATGPGTTPTSR